MNKRNFEIALSIKGTVQSDGTIVKVNSNFYPIYYQYLQWNFKVGEVLEGKLSIENNIKKGSTVFAPGLGHVIVEFIEGTKVYFIGTSEFREFKNLHPIDYQSVVFIPRVENLIEKGLLTF